MFDAIIEKVTNYDLPPCVQRITVPLPGREDGVMVAYAAMVKAADGVPKVRLIKAWNDLEGIELADNYTVAERIEKDNLRAALAQGF